MSSILKLLLLFAIIINLPTYAFVPPLHFSGGQCQHFSASRTGNDQDFGFTAKAYLKDLEQLGPVRFVVVGPSAILESTGRFNELRYTETASRGPLATVSTVHPAFECHIYLNDIFSIKALILNKFEKVLRVIRFQTDDAKTILSVILNEDSNIDAWESLLAKYGENLERPQSSGGNRLIVSKEGATTSVRHPTGTPAGAALGARVLPVSCRFVRYHGRTTVNCLSGKVLGLMNDDIEMPISQGTANTDVLRSVRLLLDQKNSIIFEDCNRALRLSVVRIEAPEVVDFVMHCLLRIVNILTEQSTARLGVVYKTVDESLMASLQILLSVSPRPLFFLEALLRMFDVSCVYYSGARAFSWSASSGMPHTRINLISKFAASSGLNLLLEILTAPGAVWLGADRSHIITAALMDTPNLLSHLETAETILSTLLQQILALTEEQLKRENQEHVSSIFLCAAKFYRSLQDTFKSNHFYALWKEYANKLAHCSVLVLKLAAWDQINELIKEALLTKPPAKRYRVTNAGTPEVNGIYEALKEDDGAYWYQKLPNSPEEPLMTLFRCVMRNKAKHWFISVLDKTKPGTSDDVDYYTFKPEPDADREPPLSGWMKAGTVSVDPCPLLEPLEPLLQPGEVEADFLIGSLATWIEETGVVAHVFGSSTHRELIARSNKLLKFLVATRALQPAHLRLIWSAVLSNHETEVVEELLSLLASVSMALSSELHEVLIDLVQESFRADSNGGVAKTTLFLEKCQKEFNTHAASFPLSSVQKLMSLVWLVYRSPAYDTLKNQVAIQDLLSLCLSSSVGAAYVSSYSQACMKELLASATSSDDTAVSRVIHALYFLFLNHATREVMSDPAFSAFPAAIVNEIKRFSALNRSKLAQAKVDARYISEGLQMRLKLLRHFYNLSDAVKASLEVLQALCEILQEPVEAEEFFLFLRSLLIKVSMKDVICCDQEECEAIFSRMLCSAQLDWTRCGDAAFDSFKQFYTEVVRRRGPGSDLELIGRATLWNIFLNAPTPYSVTNAIEAIEEVYVAYDLQEQLVADIFIHLKAAQSNGTMKHIARLASLIVSAVSSKRSLSALPHGCRGIMQRITLQVNYRRFGQSYNYYSVNVDTAANEGSFPVETHPYHCVLQLREKIADKLDVTRDKIQLEFNMKQLGDPFVHLEQLEIKDGAEVSAHVSMYTNSMYGNDDNVGSEALDVGILIAENTDRFSALIAALDAVLRVDETGHLVDSLWKLLNLLPTNPAMFDLVLDCEVDGYSAMIKSLIETSPATYAYYLQVVDALLQPAEDAAALTLTLAPPSLFRSIFVNSGGFALMLEEFIAPASNALSKKSKSYAMHILYYLMIICSKEDEAFSDNILLQVQRHSVGVTQSMLGILCDAAAEDNLSLVQIAISTIMYLLKSPLVASQLISNPQTKSMLLSVLRSSSFRVRDIAGTFASKVGETQPVVVSWLIAELILMTSQNVTNVELFKTLVNLFESMQVPADPADIQSLISHVSDIMLLFSERKISDQHLLSGYLHLLNCLLRFHFEDTSKTAFGAILVETLFNDFLFVLQSGSQVATPICEFVPIRTQAYAVLGTCMRSSVSSFRSIVRQIQALSRVGSSMMNGTWLCAVSSDIKRNSIEYVGLKNQGGTCYMNSLLQQMFMNIPLRDAILKTKLKQSERGTLWHISDEDLVGQSFYFEHFNGNKRLGRVAAYDPVTKLHKVQYPASSQDNTPMEEVVFKLREGRLGKENGKVQWISRIPGGVSEHDESAKRVLEQLQRTFCFLKYSKRRYFDPRPFVDACKTLNMNFNVYHQNDAAEFYDQLLDRLETAMKGKETGQNVWNDVVLPSVFGGANLYQKIPQECQLYLQEKVECGQVIGAREEPFFKIEVLIRGYEEVTESMSLIVQGELMDGDNKVECEVCNEKKAVTRRTCVNKLPNLLVLHLKRFDLDFTTFETVKINTRMEFSASLSMLKFSKEGIEEEERQRAIEARLKSMDEEERPSKQQNTNQLLYEVDTTAQLDPLDFEYELGGVLVHAGVAQGGHYYSFIKDSDGSWFRFEDDEVTAFDPSQIPYQCFGGTFPAVAGVGMHSMDEERTSNALLLFYTKKRPKDATTDVFNTPSDAVSSKDRLVDGEEAYINEVKASNERHAMMSYLLDPGFQPLLRDMVTCATSDQTVPPSQWAISNNSEADILHVVQLACEVLLDIVLHFKERSGMQQWIDVFHQAFRAYPKSALWLVRNLIVGHAWLQEYLGCFDTLSRSTFCDLVTEAMTAIAPQDPQVVHKYLVDTRLSDLQQIALGNSPDADTAAFVTVISIVVSSLYEPPSRVRPHDEIFAMLREFSQIPSVYEALMAMRLIEDLLYFLFPTQVSEAVRSKFKVNPNVRQDQLSFSTSQNVFEALAALMGVPQKRKVQLLLETSTYWQPELIPEAEAALQIIFSQLTATDGLDQKTFATHYEKIYGAGNKNIVAIIRNIFERFPTTADSKLSFVGFCRYHADLANTNYKLMWKCLHFYGFHNDLSRAPGTAPLAIPTGSLGLSDGARAILSDIAFYESGVEFAEGSALAIAKRVCWQERQLSVDLIDSALSRLHGSITEWTINGVIDVMVGFFKALLSINDGLFLIRIEQMLLGNNGILSKLAEERRSTRVYRSAIPPAERYENMFCSLLQESAVAVYVNQAAESNAFIRNVRDAAYSRSTNTFDNSLGDIVVGGLDMHSPVKVEGAGVHEINGEYLFKSTFDDVGWFTKSAFFRGKDVVFSLYRCKMTGGGHRWFISICPEGANPGSKDDEDFYSREDHTAGGLYTVNDRLTGRDRWISILPEYDLAPQVASTAFVDSDSREDASLNLSDDLFDDSFMGSPHDNDSISQYE